MKVFYPTKNLIKSLLSNLKNLFLEKFFFFFTQFQLINILSRKYFQKNLFPLNY